MKKKKAFYLLAVCACACGIGLASQNMGRKNINQSAQTVVEENPEQKEHEEKTENRDKVVERLDVLEGSYEKQNIILQDVSRTDAEKMAEELNAEIQVTEDEKYAVLYLNDGMDIKSVLEKDEYLDYVDNIIPDYYGTLCAGESVSGAKSVTDISGTINLNDTWNVTKGAGTKIAVIDTGIDTDNPYLASKISEDSFNVITGKTVSSYGLDVIEEGDTLTSHGTEVASVIAADYDSETGVGGIAPEAELVVIKIVDDGKAEITASNVILGMAYAIEKDVDVINMSFSFEADQNPFEKYTRLAVDSDIVCVASAGNHGTSANEWPAADDNVIGAGAVSRPDSSGFSASATIGGDGETKDTYTLNARSNYGDNTDLVAPDGLLVTNFRQEISSLSGTSASSALTSGAVALYLSQNKNQEYATVKETLYAAGNDMGTPGIDWYYGCGMLDVDALVTEEKGTITYDMLTEEVENEKHIFVRGHILQDVPEPERTYSVFDGWHHDIQCLDEWDNLEEKLYEDVTMYAAWANEDDTQAYSYVVKEDGTAEITGYLGKRRYLTMPDKIDGYMITGIGTRAFAGNTRLRRIELPDTLTEIKEAAFEECTRLLNIEIPKHVQRIEKRAFYACTRLGTVGLHSNGDLSAIGDYAFSECGSLQRMDLPVNLESVNATAFLKDMSLTTITVADGNKNFISDGEGLYGIIENKQTLIYYATGRSGSYQMNEDAVSVSEMACAYSRLSSIELSDNLEILDKSAFAYSRLARITLPDNLKTVSEEAFVQCDSLRRVTFGKSTEEIGDKAFSWCTSLEEVVPAEENILTSIGVEAFRSCTKLENLDFIGKKCETINAGAFYECLMVKEVTLPASIQKIEKYAFCGCRGIETVIFEDGIQLTQLEDWVFNGCESIKNITLPEGLKKIGENCFLVTGLEYIYIPSTVDEIGYGAFGHCLSMQKMEVSEKNPVYYTENNVLFERKTDEEKQKTSLVLHSYPAGLEGAYCISDEVDEVADWAFYAAQKLTDVQFGVNVTKIGNQAFGLCHGLKEVRFNEKLETIGEYSFAECQELQTVICDKNLQKIGKGAFWVCMSLKDVSLNEGLLELGNLTFNYCQALEEIVLPDSLQTIGTECFSQCLSLKKIEISKGVLSIGMYAFSYDSALTEITFAQDCQLSRLNYGTFASCGIQRITIPKSVESMGQEIFTSCDKLEEVVFEENSRLTALAAWTFLHADVLHTIRFEEGAELTHIEARAFEQTGNLTSIDVSKCEKLQDIDNYALNGCSQLTEFVIPKNVTHIGRYAFYGCSGLTELHMPESTDYIGRYAFAGIPNIRIYFDAPVLPENLQENWDYGIRGYYLGSGEKLSNTEWEYTLLSDGTAVLMKYIGTESSVTITKVEGYTVSAVGANVLDSGSAVQELNLPETVVSISNYAFENAGNLQKISIPSSVKMIGSYAFRNSGIKEVVFAPNSHLEYIDSYAFANTDAMTEIELPSTVSQIRKYAFYRSGLQTVSFGEESQLAEIGRYAFASTGLTELQLPDHELKVDYHAFDGAEKLAEVQLGSGRLQMYGYAFYNTALVNVDIPVNVEYIGEYCFSFCKELLSFRVSEENKYYSSDEGILFNKTGLKLIQCPAGKTGSYAIPDRTEALGFGAFEGSHLSEINISDQSSLQTIGYKAFYNCEQIRSIHIPATVVSLDYYAFAYCKKLNNLDLAEGSTLNGIYEGAFYGCESLAAIQIPNSVMEIGEYAFYGCESLSKVGITENSMLQGIFAHAFEHTAISEIRIPDSVLEIGSYAFADCKLKTATTGKGTREVGAHAFSDNSGMTEFTFDESLIAVDNGVLSGNDAIGRLNIYCYAKCQDITAGNIFGYKTPVTLTEIDLQNVNTIPAEAFINSKSLVKITTDGSVNRIEGSAFENCSDLESITGTENVEYYGLGAFRNCSKLKQVSFANAKVVEGYAFYMCEALEEAAFSEKLETIGDRTFLMCYSLKKVIITAKKTGNVIMGESAFASSGIETLQLGYGIEYIPGDCFSMTNIEELILPDSVINIDANAFEGCQKLNKVEFGEKTKYIKESAFANCDKLKNVILNEGIEEIGDYAFAYGHGWIGYDDTDCMLNSIWIPASVKKIGSGVFTKANVFFEAVNLPEGVATDWDASSDKVKAFMNCGPIMEINGLYYHLTDKGAVAVYYDGKESELVVNLPEEQEITFVCDGCFEDNKNLISVDLGTSVKEIGTKAFKNCEALQIARFGTKVEKIGANAFLECTELTETSMLQNIKVIGESAFGGCAKLDFPEMNRNLQSIGRSAFAASGITDFECNKLEDGVIHMWAFSGCTKLETIVLNAEIEKLEYGAFSACTELVKVSLPKELKQMDGSSFANCTKLEELNVPETLEKLDTLVFARCTNLKKIIIPETVKYIDRSCFEENRNLVVCFVASELPEGLTHGWDTTIKGYVLGYLGDKIVTDAENGFSYFITNDGIEVYAYAGMEAELELDTIDGYKVTKIRKNTFSNNKYLKQVYIGKTVQIIEDGVFENCTNLEKIEFASNAILKKIGASCFKYCKSLKTIKIPDTVESVGKQCFENCDVINDVKLPEEMREIQPFTFWGCKNLCTMTMPQNVEKVGRGAFPASMIEEEEGLKYVYTYLVGYLKTGQTEYTIRKGTTVIEEEALNNCRLMKKIEIPDTLRRLPERVFEGTALTELKIPETVVKIEENALSGLEHLEKITLPAHLLKQDMDSMEYIFGRRYNPWKIDMADSLEKIYVTGDAEAVKIVLPETVKEINFSGSITKLELSTLGDIIFPAGLEVLDIDVPWEKINIPEGVKNASIHGENLKAIELPETIRKIGISGCKALEKFAMPDSVTEMLPDAFTECSSLKEIQISPNVKGVYIGQFRECDALEKITMPIIAGNIMQMSELCSQMPDLKELVINGNAETIPSLYFYGCHGVERIIVPGTIQEIGSYAFGYCKSLKSINIPTECKKIGESAFCESGLEKITLPAELVEIGIGAFNSCSKLESLEILGSDVKINCDFVSPILKKVVLPYIGTAPNKPCKFRELIQSDSLETVILLDSCTSMAEDAFEGVSGIDIYCYADADTTVWPTGWNNGNRVHYMNQWNHMEFKVDGQTVFTSIHGIGDALKLPAKSMYEKASDDRYEYTFLGWDIDGDGKAENLFTSTLRGYITAEAVYSRVPRDRASHVTVQNVESKENQAVVDISGDKADALKAVASLNSEILGAVGGKETTIKTDVGTVIFDKGASSSIASSADQVNVTLEQVNPELLKDAADKDQLYQLSLMSDGNDITFSGSAEIQLPYDTDDSETPVVTWLSSDGKQITMEAHYSEKQNATVFNTAKFSLYALSKITAETGTIVFDTDGGTAVAELHKAIGRGIVLPECEKENAILTGWRNGEKFYTLDDEYTVTADATLTAVWKEKTDISELKDQLVLSDELNVYTGQEIKKSVQVGTLEEEKDFNVAYSDDLINVGTVTVTVTGIGRYRGSFEVTYQIEPKSLQTFKDKISLGETEFYHDGTEKKPEVTVEGLQAEKDYTLEYQNNVEVGTAIVKISGTGNYCDEVELEYALIHNPETVDKIEPDCTNSGRTEGTQCQFCGTVLSGEEELPPLGHDYGEWSTVRGATCTEAGEEERICSRDESHTENRAIPAAGHQKKEIEEIPATCTEAGRSAGTECIVCGLVLSGEEELPPLGHDYGEWSTVRDATCTEAGEEERICSRDESHTESRAIPAAGHQKKEIEEIPATCTEAGRSAGTECIVCGQVLSGEEEILPLGHDYGDWIVVKEATYTEDGIEEQICSRDSSHKQTRSIPKQKVPLSSCEVELSDSIYMYDGVEKKPTVTVVYKGMLLNEGTDYNLLYTDNINPGTAAVTIEALETSSYTGSIQKKYVIRPAMDDSAVIVQPNAFESCANLVNVNIRATVTEIGDQAFADCKNLRNIYFFGNSPKLGKTIFKNVKATAYYPYNDATWTLDKFQNYGGTITWCPWNPQTGKPAKRDLSQCEISLNTGKLLYDGKAKTPQVTVKDSGQVIRLNEDYTVSYRNNVNPGTGIVTVSGQGGYEGLLTARFSIDKGNNVVTVSDITKNFSKKAQKAKVNASVYGGARLTYASNSKSVKVDKNGNITIAKKFIGKAVITVKALETACYKADSRQFSVTVKPSVTSISKVKNSAKKKITVTWKRNKTCSGYTIQYSLDKRFRSGVKTIYIGKNRTTKKILSGFAKGKTYYVRLASYKKIGSTKILSNWSKVKKVKIRK